ncbi:MAG TPA: DNA-formamidopyrimidine glycosylase family protein [Candidatus Binatia bacterium]|nr:DNA-formamidopyrimidine glycosylase family protein [Candidatus Binatia bacterium]
MPERPDLEYVIPILHRELTGRRITGVRVRKPVVLRILIDGAPDSLFVGATFRAVTRRAHFVLFDFAAPRPLALAIAPMLAGRFALDRAPARTPADLALAWKLSDGRELRYRDDVQMGKVYVLAPDAWDSLPGLARVGVDVFDAGRFTAEVFGALAKQRRDQVKVFLMDKSAIDSMGNAYADEVLWEARIHPKRMTRSLDDDELERLRNAIVHVLRNATDTIAQRRPPLDEKLRDFLAVRGRAGQPCQRCGATIRTTRVRADDAHFCPQCQPDQRRRPFIDWRRVSGAPTDE